MFVLASLGFQSQNQLERLVNSCHQISTDKSRLPSMKLIQSIHYLLVISLIIFL